VRILVGAAAVALFRIPFLGSQPRSDHADRKRPIRDYLLAIAIFANGAKGHSALQLSRDLNC
jgi:hypothetical protein